MEEGIPNKQNCRQDGGGAEDVEIGNLFKSNTPQSDYQDMSEHLPHQKPLKN